MELERGGRQRSQLRGWLLALDQSGGAWHQRQEQEVDEDSRQVGWQQQQAPCKGDKEVAGSAWV